MAPRKRGGAQTAEPEVVSPLGAKFYARADEKRAVAEAERKLAADPRNIDLILAHEENSDLLVENERSRFARDLHDILGHSLTVITVKAELAPRAARARFGIPKTERSKSAAERTLEARRLDGMRREDRAAERED